VAWSLGSAKYRCLARAAAGEKSARAYRGHNRNPQANERGVHRNTNPSPKQTQPNGLEAFQEMFLAARPRFLGMAKGILRNDADAEDAVQNACLSAYLHLHTFEGRSCLKTWFTRILINASLMHKRKHRAVVFGPYIEDDEIGWTERIQVKTPNPEQAYAQEERLELIDGVVAKMKPLLRQAFTMTYYDEMSTQEACAALGVSCGTFKARLFRAKRQLFRRLKRNGVPRVRSLSLR
jgi:RNA polymerase sigma-70 factor (ECF subfamily)